MLMGFGSFGRYNFISNKGVLENSPMVSSSTNDTAEW